MSHSALGTRLLQMAVLILLIPGAWFSGTAYAAFSDSRVVIGIVSDFSSSQRNLTADAAAIVAQMAVDDYGHRVSVPVHVVTGDYGAPGATVEQVMTDLGGRRRGLDMVTGFTGNREAMAVQRFAFEQRVVSFNTGSHEPELQRSACTPYGFHWAPEIGPIEDIANGYLRSAAGRSTLFRPNTHGGSEQEWLIQHVNGETTVRSADYRGSTSLFQSLGRVSSGLNPGDEMHVSVATGGGESLRAAVRYAYEMGLLEVGVTTFAMQLDLPVIHAIGHYHARGIAFPTTFLWNRTEETMAWANRFYQRAGIMPSAHHAAIYSAVAQYLGAVTRVRGDDTEQVVNDLKGRVVDDVYARKAAIREDGRLMQDVFVARVKSPTDSRRAWDYAAIETTFPARLLYGANSLPCGI